MEIAQHPKGDNKFITVEALLDFADALRQQEIEPGRIICADGIIGMRNELRGLKTKRG